MKLQFTNAMPITV